MSTEYQRLGGHLPHELQTIVKEYSMPRYMKPTPQVIAQLKILNSDGGILNTYDDGTPRGKGKSCMLVLTRVLLYGTKKALGSGNIPYKKFYGPF